MSGSNPTLETAENLCQQDLNNDGHFGLFEACGQAAGAPVQRQVLPLEPWTVSPKRHNLACRYPPGSQAQVYADIWRNQADFDGLGCHFGARRTPAKTR